MTDELEFPIASMRRIFGNPEVSLETGGFMYRAIGMMIVFGRALPASDKSAAMFVHAPSVHQYRRLRDECVRLGFLVKLTTGEFTAPILKEARRAKGQGRIPRTYITGDHRDRVLDKTEGICAYCGIDLTFGDPRDLTAYVVDHILPVVRGGTEDIGNLMPSCRSCNAAKGAKTALQFMNGKAHADNGEAK